MMFEVISKQPFQKETIQHGRMDVTETHGSYPSHARACDRIMELFFYEFLKNNVQSVAVNAMETKDGRKFSVRLNSVGSTKPVFG